jgi:hypothetical protein
MFWFTKDTFHRPRQRIVQSHAPGDVRNLFGDEAAVRIAAHGPKRKASAVTRDAAETPARRARSSRFLIRLAWAPEAEEHRAARLQIRIGTLLFEPQHFTNRAGVILDGRRAAANCTTDRLAE